MRLTRRLGLLAAAATLTITTAVSAAPTYINILTGGTSGVYYPIGVAISQLYGKIDGASPRFRRPRPRWRTSICCKAVVANWPCAGRLGIRCLNGVEDAGFRAPLTAAGHCRDLQQLHPGGRQCRIGHPQPEDLKGKRISVGAPKSGTELNARAISPPPA